MEGGPGFKPSALVLGGGREEKKCAVEKLINTLVRMGLPQKGHS